MRLAPDLVDEIQRKLAKEPHEEVDDIIKSIRETGRRAGKDVVKFLDSLPLGRKGPHRAIDALLSGIESGAERAQKK